MVSGLALLIWFVIS
ncbi:hypothetical protein [Pantoea sp. At-9b]|nr:hypothetical protein [Pantoea sp. At-9b]